LAHKSYLSYSIYLVLREVSEACANFMHGSESLHMLPVTHVTVTLQNITCRYKYS